MVVKAEKVVPSVEQEEDDLDTNVDKFLGGGTATFESLKDKKLKGQLSFKEKLYVNSARTASKHEKWLLPTEGGHLETEGIEKTWGIKQEDIAREVDVLSRAKQFDIVLPDLGPYAIDYTPSGRYMAVGGRKGQLVVVDVTNLSVVKEFQVGETVRDITFLHNESFFAAAQKKYPYIYDSDGTELHCLKEHGAVLKLQFLKIHFLLSSINKCGQLRYQDVTTGEMVGNYWTVPGRTDVMRVNPFNSVLALGHSNGTVTMRKPTSKRALFTLLSHHAPVTTLAFHPNGHLMASSGLDQKIKLWDLRKYQVIQTIPFHAESLDFSQKGQLVAAKGSFLQVVEDRCSNQNYRLYMKHSMAKGYQIKNVLFRPYEDVLGIGHSKGWSSILIPGSGEPNFDSWVANPFEMSKQKREKEVKSLLDKLPPESIRLDPSKIGGVIRPTKEERVLEIEQAKAKTIKKAKRLLWIPKKRQRVDERHDLSKSLQRFVRKRTEHDPSDATLVGM